MQLISLQNISVKINQQVVLEDISFTVKRGEYVGLVGPNGAGKTTLLKVILGVVKPYQGKIIIPSKLTFGYVPQTYILHRKTPLSVQEFLEMGLKRNTLWRKSSEKKLLLEKLECVELGAFFLDKTFQNLSGGEKQRVTIAKSLLQNPHILLFDESLNSVDIAIKMQIYKLLSRINTELNITIIFASHEVESVTQECQRILCLNKKLYHGCHPIKFIFGEECSNESEEITSHLIHHHHTLSN